MEITIYAKKRVKEEGGTFYSYLTKMRKKDGTDVTVAVKFREECGHPKPENCPMNVIVDKEKANMSTRDFIREDTGEIAKSHTLWVTSWRPGSEYVDKSLDDFE